jgi:arylsulfatase A-like enzyme
MAGLSALRLLVILASVGGLMTALALFQWSRAEKVMKPYYRFVESHLRHEAGAARVSLRIRPRLGDGNSLYLPTANIRDETRYVLSSPDKGSVVAPRFVTVPGDGRIELRERLPPPLAKAKRVVLLPSVRRGPSWSGFPPVVAPVDRSAKTPSVEINLALPQTDAGASLKIRVDAVAIDEQAASSWQTSSVRIPLGARLDFGFGILQAAWQQGPVEFTIRACDGNDCEQLFSETVDPRGRPGQEWIDRSISLSRFAWRKRSLRFQTRCLRPGAGVFSLPVWSNPTVSAPSQRPAEMKNVILLSLDTLSARHLRAYGYEHDTSPFIEETFTKNGTVFERCVAAAATTPPSHMTMFTSVQPCVHGMTTGEQFLPLWLTTLAAVLRGDGLETGAVTEDGWLGIVQGFGRGFNAYAENRSPDLMAPLGQVDVTFAKARHWLARNRDKHFFLFLHTFQVHDPYAPPPEYKDLFRERADQVVNQESAQHLRDAVDYDQEIRYTDDQLRQLFEALSEHGLDRNTIFIIVSDHGEEFFQHGLWGHGAHLYEEVTRVPLMFWGPGVIPAGKRVAAPVGHIDLMPTILDLVGVPPPGQVMGRSFIDSLTKEAADPKSRPLFSEAWGGMAMFPDRTSIPFKRPAYLVQIGTRKLSRYRQEDGFRYEYYDVAADPEERQNLYPERRGEVEQMQQQLDQYENACKVMAAGLAKSAGASAGGAPTKVELDPGQEEKLRALGYIE